MPVTNAAIAKIFENMATFLEMKGDSFFKIRAYHRAARTIEHLSFSLEQAVRDGMDLGEIPGFGSAISTKTRELIETGKMAAYEKLKAEFPEGVLDLSNVSGIGAKTAMTIARELGVRSIDDLEQAILDGRLAQLPRMGEKTAENILRHIQYLRDREKTAP